MKLAAPLTAVDAYRQKMADPIARARRGQLLDWPHDSLTADRIADALDAMIAALDPVPDDDPRWAHSFRSDPDPDKQSTYAQSPGAFMGPHIEAHFAQTGDDVCRWAIISEDWLVGQPDFGLPFLEPLIDRDPLELRWVVAGACWILTSSGWDPTVNLAGFLARLAGKLPSLDATLQAMASADPHARLMADIARSVSGGSKLQSIDTGWWPTQ